MREQVVPQKVGNRAGITGTRRSGGVAQRPQRRERSGESSAVRFRKMLAYVPTFLKLVLAIGIGALIFAGYRAAAAASFFQIRNVEVKGIARASAHDVESVVRREVGETGVWQADIQELSDRLERLPWVRVAVVSRLLPDGIRVRIAERQPRAVVRMTSGRFFWVDDDAVLLGEMLPTDQIPPFFLRGWNEEAGDAARQENVERVRRFLTLQHEWDAAGLSARVSEVNLIDIRDVRAQLAEDDSQIEVRLGSQDFGKRLKDALKALDYQRQTPRGPFISYVDITQGKRAIIGFISGAHTISEGLEGGLAPAGSEGRDVKAVRSVRNDNTTTASATRAEPRKAREAKPNPNERNIEERPRRARPTQ